MYKFNIKGTDYEIPSLADIPAGAFRKARAAANEMDKAFIILEETLGIDSPELKAVDSLSITELVKWLEGWTDGVGLGESQSSGK